MLPRDEVVTYESPLHRRLNALIETKAARSWFVDG